MSEPAGPKSASAETPPVVLRRVALSGLLGTVIEYYDFLLYGTMAAIVFGDLFFPGADPLAGTIASFGALAVGYVARPVGGIVFGHFGDRIGRKSMLIVTMTMMGVASVLIGLLPSYATIGVAAPVLLVLLRIVQGVAVGGEWAGATLMVVEHADPRRRGLWNGLLQMGSPLGSVVSTGAVALVTQLPEDQLMSWGWRVPFLCSALLLGVGLYMRLHVGESPQFEAARDTGRRPRFPLTEVLRSPRAFLLASAVGIGPFALNALVNTFMITYGKAIGYATSDVVTGVLITALIGLVAIPLFSALSDRVGRRAVVLCGAIAAVLVAVPVYLLVNTGVVALLYAGMVLGQLAQNAMFAPLGPLLSEMFGVHVRYTGVSLGYQMGALLGGGFTPLLATSVFTASGSPSSTPLVVLAVLCGLVTLVAVRYTGAAREEGPAPSGTVDEAAGVSSRG